MGSGLVDLHLKSTLAGEFTISTISRFWLPLGEESARPQMSKYQNTENKRLLLEGICSLIPGISKI